MAWSALLLAAAARPLAAADVDVARLLWAAVMTPATARAAAAAKLRPGRPAPPPAAGDQVVALVSLDSPDTPPTQWLLRVAMADAGHRAAAGGRDATLYTTVGDAFVFHSGAPATMDLDILASVQTQIIGNCLCVLGDAMAMPVGSIVQKFRGELEAEIEAAAERANTVPVAPIQDAIPVGAH